MASAIAHFDCPTIECHTRKDWLAARRSLIGASDTAGIFGVGYANQSRATVWDSKVHDRPEDFGAEDKRLRIGRLMEPALRAIFTDETGLPCEDPGEHLIHVHPEYDFIGATLDSVTDHDEYGRCPVELKNVSSFLRREWEDDEPPLKFQVQVQHQIAVTGAQAAFLLGLVGGNEPVVKVIERNDRFISVMLERLAEFWDFVQRKEMPPVDSSEATAKLLAQLWPEDSGATVMLPAEAAEWDRQLCDAKEAIKEATARKLAAENQIKAALGENTFGELPGGGRYSWKTQEEHHKAKPAKVVQKRVLRRGK